MKKQFSFLIFLLILKEAAFSQVVKSSSNQDTILIPENQIEVLSPIRCGAGNQKAPEVVSTHYSHLQTSVINSEEEYNCQHKQSIDFKTKTLLGVYFITGGLPPVKTVRQIKKIGNKVIYYYTYYDKGDVNPLLIDEHFDLIAIPKLPLNAEIEFKVNVKTIPTRHN